MITVVKTPTMKDVARVAEVSIQTVSCVVNGKEGISDQTRERVLNVIEQLNYQRDPIARSMRTGKTGFIAVLVPDIANPVLSTLVNAVEADISAEDFNVLLYNANADPERENAYLELATNRLVDGVIIVNAVDQMRTVRTLQEKSAPAVLIDCLPTRAVPYVTVDNLEGAYLATQHLIKQGHTRIAHIRGSTSHELARLREQGYLKALSDYELSYQQIALPENDVWDYQGGYTAMQRLLAREPRPTGVFAAGDRMALGAYRAITEAGLRVPDHISVVGFDDIEAARFATPPLTTIHQPNRAMASQAVSLLVQLISNQHPETTHLILSPRLIVRQSTTEAP